MIPKIIWQTHEARPEDLESFQKNISNTWNFLNPTWIHKYVDSEERLIDIENYDQEMTSIYLRLSKNNQANLWKFITIYQNGGAYASMYSVCKKPIDHFMQTNYTDQEIVCNPVGFEANDNEVNDYSFIANKNSEILKNIIDSIKNEYTVVEANNPGSELFEDQSMIDTVFSTNVMANQEKVLFGFDCANYGDFWKNDFMDYEIIYDNQDRPYTEIATRENWQLY